MNTRLLFAMATTVLLMSCADEDKPSTSSPPTCFDSGVQSCHMLFAGEDIYSCDPNTGAVGDLKEDCDDSQYCRPDAAGQPSCSDLSLCFVICDDDCFQNNPDDPEACVGTFYPAGSVTPMGLLSTGDIEQYANPDMYDGTPNFTSSMDDHCMAMLDLEYTVGNLANTDSVVCTPKMVWAATVDYEDCPDGSSGCMNLPDEILEAINR